MRHDQQAPEMVDTSGRGKNREPHHEDANSPVGVGRRHLQLQTHLVVLPGLQDPAQNRCPEAEATCSMLKYDQGRQTLHWVAVPSVRTNDCLEGVHCDARKWSAANTALCLNGLCSALRSERDHPSVAISSLAGVHKTFQCSTRRHDSTQAKNPHR